MNTHGLKLLRLFAIKPFTHPLTGATTCSHELFVASLSNIITDITNDVFIFEKKLCDMEARMEARIYKLENLEKKEKDLKIQTQKTHQNTIMIRPPCAVMKI